MIIDFHTHVFPDKIAERTISLLSHNGGIEPHSDGTVAGLLRRMEEADVDISVALPVLTSPAQFDSVNRFAAGINEEFKSKSRRIISFAGIHPACEDIEGKMRFIRDSGFLGVKIHPDYQNTFINDESYVKIVSCAKEHGLIVVTHSGVDGAYRDKPVRCTPELALDLLSRVPHERMVFAHLGANEMPKKTIELLAGRNVYFDTAYALRYTERSDFMKILELHGEDRILFATDSPWSSMTVDLGIIRSYGLSEETESKILYKNAAALLGI